MMNAKRFTRALAFAPREKVIALAQAITGNHTVLLIKPPQKTLIMLKIREPVKNSVFYLGEALATECLLEVDEQRGAAVLLGDDFEKAQAIAVLDAAFHAGFPETAFICAGAAILEETLRIERAKDNALHQATRVQFRILEDKDAD